jgi:hypothetical protein
MTEYRTGREKPGKMDWYERKNYRDSLRLGPSARKTMICLDDKNFWTLGRV